MYKYLVVGVTLIIILGAGYYMREGGADKLLGNAYNTDAHSNLNPPTPDSVPGIYFCTELSGCESTSTLTLKEDNTLEITIPKENPNLITIATTSLDEVSQNNSDNNENQGELAENEGSEMVPPGSLFEKGTWEIARTMLIITLTESGTTTYDTPRKIIIQNVSSTTLSRISYNRTDYPALKKPIFLRQDY